MFEWPFEMPRIGDETEYGTVVYKSEDGASRCIDWLEPVLEDAERRGLDLGGGDEMEFLENLDIEIFVMDYGAPPVYGTVFIGVAMGEEEATLKKARKALRSLGKRK